MEMSIVSVLWEALFIVPVAYVVIGTMKGER